MLKYMQLWNGVTKWGDKTMPDYTLVICGVLICLVKFDILNIIVYMPVKTDFYILIYLCVCVCV